MTAPGAVAKEPWLLIVEDDWDVRQALIEVLQDKQVAVAAAGNGLEALMYLTEAKVLPRLILLDLMMPVWVTGSSVSISSRSPRGDPSPSFLMTAHGSFKDDRDLMGLDGKLTKPLQLKELFELVERYRPEEP